MFNAKLVSQFWAIAFLVATLVGCQAENPLAVPVAPAASTPEFVPLPQPLTPSLKKVVTARAYFTVANGGTLALHDSYVAANGQTVTLDVVLTARPGDMPYDADLTMVLDDSLLMSSVDLTFGPHGIVFNRALELRMEANGINLDPTLSNNLKLFYIQEDNTWEKMPGSNAQYQNTALDGKGKLPHFSRYAFGR